MAARHHRQELTALLAITRRRLEDSLSELTDFVNEAKAAVSAADDNLRKAGLASYVANPVVKTLPFGLGVRITSALDYSTDAAFAWAIEHKMALSCDKKAFECIAKTHNVPFVTNNEVVTDTLTTDAAKLLTE